MGKIYTRSGEKAQNPYPMGGGGGEAQTYIAYIREYPPPQEYSQLSLLFPHYRESIIAGVSFRQTSVVYFWLGFSCCPYYWGVRKTRLRDAALVIDDNVAKKDDDNKYDAAFSIIIIAVK